MRLLKIFLLLGAASFAASCASLISGQAQNITILTPGASEAKCTLDNGIRYSVSSGETIQIMRNEKDIVVECYATGNRYRKMTIESDGNKWAIGNVATGIVPGVTFDHFSKGLYEYPEVITVDFVGVPTGGFELPEYHNKDMPNPYDQAIEYYGPSVPKMESDKSFLKNEVTKKTRSMADPFTLPADQLGTNSGVTPLPNGEPVSLQKVDTSVPRGSSAEELNRAMNPSVFRTN